MTNEIVDHPPSDKAPLLFDAVLAPHRSLSPRGFCFVMVVACGLNFVLGLAFFLMGAWPVVGFLGLDMLLLWGAFRLSYRSGRLRETLQLSRNSLMVRRTLPSGRAREWRFQPYWLRVEIDTGPPDRTRLTLASHGRRLIIGAFLAPDERIELAQALKDALGKLRCLPEPATQT